MKQDTSKHCQRCIMIVAILSLHINQGFSLKMRHQLIPTSPHSIPFIQADWPAPSQVHTFISTRQGGISQGNYASLNLATHVGDNPDAVAHNRTMVQQIIPKPIAYLNQTHSNHVVQAATSLNHPLNADASIDNTGTVACAVMTADCLPILLCDDLGTTVAAIHAGWRGLANGIIQNTIKKMNIEGQKLLAWLGPAISANVFEVGQDVYDAFCRIHPQAHTAFSALNHQKYLANLYLLAHQILQSEHINHIYGGNHCTFTEDKTFFSYRRNGQTGRMISAIWLEYC